MNSGSTARRGKAKIAAMARTFSNDPSRVGDRPTADRLTLQVLAVTEIVGDFIESWGFRSIHGRVWALLALRKTPMAQAEIAETLGVSRSLVNLAVSELLSYGLVRATDEGRNAPYEANWDVWVTITDVIRQREWMLIERARVALEAALAEAEFAQESGRATDFDADRIRLLLAMTEFAQAILKAVLSVRMPRSVDTFAKWLGRAARTVHRLDQALAAL